MSWFYSLLKWDEMGQRLKYGLPIKKKHMVLEFYPTENIP